MLDLAVDGQPKAGNLAAGWMWLFNQEVQKTTNR